MTTEDQAALDQASLSGEVASLRARIEELEAEREIRRVLALYGFYADHHRSEEWLDLWTDDAVLDTVLYIADHSAPPSPDQFRVTKTVGRDQLRSVIDSPAHESISGASQHHMDGTPATLTRVDDDTFLVHSYSVTFAKDKGNSLPGVTYQAHNMNRLVFRRVDGRWKIAENLQRRMGHPETSLLYADV